MTNPVQVEVVRRHVLDALAKGARLQTGLHPGEWNTDKGLFIPPMVLTDVRHDMALMHEETFGPVLPVIPFDTEEEAIALANDSAYGLGASVWTVDIQRGRRVASRLLTGNVLINDVVVSIANHNLPYGGEKESGLGRYHGPAGLRTFCVEKAVMVDRGWLKREINWFPYAGKYLEFRRLVVSYYGARRRWIPFLAAFVRLLRLSRKRQAGRHTAFSASREEQRM
jgi:acyl-CoA reductase-like NAD-dependent aldehyde dehydrogenase